ncbi:hypothetical protein CR513_26003, partial [Mucuna pruriens]
MNFGRHEEYGKDTECMKVKALQGPLTKGKLKRLEDSFAFDPTNNADFYFDLGNSGFGFGFDFDFDIGEDPHKHIKEFHVVCSTMRPHGILEDYIKMKAFPFSLDGATKDWMYL